MDSEPCASSAPPLGPTRLRLSAWHDAEAAPEAGERCATCWGRWWWCEAAAPRRGWRCWCCIPAPLGLAVREVET
jgi:hypothetical protein